MSDLITFPHLHLLVSGGNSQIIYLQNWQNWQVVGQTLDDAAGECLDKIGRMIGLNYPGGVNLAKIAGTLDENSLEFPIGMKNQQKIPKNSQKILENNKQIEKLQNLQILPNSILPNSNLTKQQIFKTRKLNSFLNKKNIPILSQNEKKSDFLQTEKLETELETVLENAMENGLKNNLESQEIIQKLKTLNLNYSFSGLKTAVRYFVQKQKFENWEFEKKLTKNENLILQNWLEIQDFLKMKEKSEQNLLNKVIITKISKNNLESKSKIQETDQLKTSKIYQIAKKYLQNLEEKLIKNQQVKIEVDIQTDIEAKTDLKNLKSNLEFKTFTEFGNQKMAQNQSQSQKNNQNNLENLEEKINEKLSLINLGNGKTNKQLDEQLNEQNEQILNYFWQKLQIEIKTENWQKLELFYKICVCGQSAVITQLIAKFKLAISIFRPKSLGISGGVSANLLLRQKIQNLAKTGQMELFIPIQTLTGDNAVMIALAGLADIWAENMENKKELSS